MTERRLVGEEIVVSGVDCVRAYLMSFNVFRSSSDHPISLINAFNIFAPYVLLGWVMYDNSLAGTFTESASRTSTHIFFPTVVRKEHGLNHWLWCS